jgi:hypothetical protein
MNQQVEESRKVDSVSSSVIPEHKAEDATRYDDEDYDSDRHAQRRPAARAVAHPRCRDSIISVNAKPLVTVDAAEDEAVQRGRALTLDAALVQKQQAFIL